MKVNVFPLQDVRLLEGPFSAAQTLHREVLLRYEPSRFLARFRSEAGLPSEAESYGGWEANTIVGHSVGHYLSACALMFASTGDERFKQQVAALVEGLAACQDANGNGYIGGIPDGQKVFEEQIARGDIRAAGFDLNGFWVPFYTHHKLFAGLRDAYRLVGNSQALEVGRAFGEWVGMIVKDLSEDQVQTILSAEHGGMNEVLVDLYVDTGTEDFLELSRRFHHKAVLDPLSQGVDCLPGMHANTQIPKLIGLARRYQVAGDKQDLETAEFFWDRVVNHHSYVTGGHCLIEHFGPADKLNDRLGVNTTESCNVYNMLKLTSLLFEEEPRAELADFYERALYNHILATQHPGDGRLIYNLSLAMGGYKQYLETDGFTCCGGTGMENHARYGDSIYFHGEDCLYVNLFIASELKWHEQGLTLRQETLFPDADSSRLVFNLDVPRELTVHVRCPYWAAKGMEATLNGNAVDTPSTPGSYLELRRLWQSDDRLDIRFPMDMRTEVMPDNASRAAFLYGPIALAGELGEEADPAADLPGFVPCMVAEDNDAVSHVKAHGASPCTFRTDGLGRNRDVDLYPFFRMHEKRYSVYWDFMTPEEWAVEEAKLEAERTRLEDIVERTVDAVQPGDDASEQQHNLQGEDSTSGAYLHRTNRYADKWFTYDLAVLPDQEMNLRCMYWGSEGGRIFDVLLEGEKIGSERLDCSEGERFFERIYPIPIELTRDKQKVTVRFEGLDTSATGSVYGIQTVRA